MSKRRGAEELFREVVNNGLCTGCGACVRGCPYIAVHEGSPVLLDKCIETDGECYKNCPRTYTDLNYLSREINGTQFGVTEIGYYQDIKMMRSIDPKIRKKSQDGGIVTDILCKALEKKNIDAVVCSKMDEEKKPRGFLARSRDEIMSCSGSSYESSYSLEALHKINRDKEEKIALVGLGCQIESVSKMLTSKDGPKNNIELTIGLFCGWTLNQKAFHPYLETICDISEIKRFDIPHSPNYTFDVYTNNDMKISKSLGEIKPYINSGCDYCWDMTAEYADISIGSAGSAFPGWNTVVIRTNRGRDAIETMLEANALETQELPLKRIEHLKNAAINRKKKAFQKMIGNTEKSEELMFICGIDKKQLDEILKS